MKRTTINNIPDFKDAGGMWVKSYYPIPYEQHHTRSGILWKSINARSKVGGIIQKKYPTYIGTVNGFTDFQEFAEWCQDQYGYLHKEENGKYWQLDKDLIGYGNKVYCKEKCLFVPNRINSLLIARDAARGKYPLGVSWDKDVDKFRSSCNDGGKIRTIGRFEDPSTAHQEWQKYKIEVMEDILLNDEEIKLHKKLVPVIERHIQRIQDDLTNNRETF